MLGTELKNNNVKLAKWSTQALLAGSDLIKIGYVSRAEPHSNKSHVIFGAESYKPTQFAGILSLNMAVAWGKWVNVVCACPVFCIVIYMSGR